MKLSMIGLLQEGFGIDTSSHTWEGNFLDGETPHENRSVYKSAIQGGALYFSEADNPHDIVKVVPALKAESLDHFIDDRKLPTFQGGKIFYAFKTEVADTYRNQALMQVLGPIDEVLERENGGITVGELWRLSNRYQTPQKFGDSRQPDPVYAQKLIQAAGAATRIYKLYGVKAPQTVNDYRLGTARRHVLQRSGASYVLEMAYEFAQRMKHPTPADKPILDKFLELTMQQFKKMPAEMLLYDYVVVPASSSQFNNTLARMICQETGAQPLPINKLKAGQVTVNRDQLYQRGHEIESKTPGHQTPDGYKLALKGKPVQKFKKPEEFAAAWADNETQKWQKELGKIKPEAEPKIKNLPQDKRRYIKMFNPDDAQAAQGKEVLVIDDNVAGGGTVELIHEILTGLPNQPLRIDIFVPLRLDGW